MDDLTTDIAVLRNKVQALKREAQKLSEELQELEARAQSRGVAVPRPRPASPLTGRASWRNEQSALGRFAIPLAWVVAEAVLLGADHSPLPILGALAWLGGIITFVAVAQLRTPATKPRPYAGHSSPRLPWPTLLPVLSILLVGFALRVIWLETLPPLIRADEGFLADDALAIVNQSKFAPWFFGTGWQSNPTFHMYLEALMIQLVGIRILALRLVSAFAGVLLIAVIYAAGKELANVRVGLTAAAIAAAAPVDLQISRYSDNWVETVICATIAFTALHCGMRALAKRPAGESLARYAGSGALGPFAIAGVSAGLGAYFYFGAWGTTVALGLSCAYALVCFRRVWLEAIVSLVTVGAGLLVVDLPLLMFFRNNPGASGSSRAFGELYLFAGNHLQQHEAELQLSSPVLTVLELFREAIEQFFTRADRSGFFPFGDRAVVTPPVALLFAIGLIAVIATARRWSSALVLIWFIVTVILGNVLFGTPVPYTPRVVTAIPAVYLMAAIGFATTLSLVRTYLAPDARWLVNGLAGAMLLGITVYSAWQFFDGYYADGRWADRGKIVAYVRQLPAGTQIDGLFDTEDIIPYVRYVGSGDSLFLTANSTDFLAKLQTRPGPVTIVVSGPQANVLPTLQRRFAGHVTTTVVDSAGKTLFYVLTVNSP